MGESFIGVQHTKNKNKPKFDSRVKDNRMKKINDLIVEPGTSDKFRDFFNVASVKRLFRMGTEIINAAQPFIQKQNMMTAIQSAALIGRVIVDDMEVWPDDYFDDKWENPYPLDFNKMILAALQKKPYKSIKTSDDAVTIRILQLDKERDVKIGYVFNSRSNFVDRLCVEVDKYDIARELIKKELWSMLKDENIVLRRINNKNSDYDNCNVDLEIDDAFNPMPSKKAEEYSAYLKKCIDADVSRSVLLYGPPGTGKSTLARTIISSLGLRSFRIRVEDIANISPSTIFEALGIFEPDAVIIDDFDRLGDQASMLEALEHFQRHTKLVIATVNNKNRLDNAILRPGRFDELIHIKQMDGDVVRNVLGTDHADSFDTVKDWPIAFIQEYVKRCRFMTSEEAENSTKELAQRVKGMFDSEDDDISKVIDKLESKNNSEEISALSALMNRGKKNSKYYAQKKKKLINELRESKLA